MDNHEGGTESEPERAIQPGERLIHRTTGLCRECKGAVKAQVVATVSGEVWMRKRCKEHGPQEVRISDSAAWYEATRVIEPRATPSAQAPRAVEHGCPFDCGSCEAHAQDVRLPVVTITSACNLDCPICYVHNRNEGAYHMGVDEFRALLGHLVTDHRGELDLLNFTGGEPTLHPHLLDFLRIAREAGVHRVSLCSNGLKLARDEALVESSTWPCADPTCGTWRSTRSRTRARGARRSLAPGVSRCMRCSGASRRPPGAC
jgi:uncharacterized radical SAM superfamily Fe-S cluster-containing enzyme